jgi:hypothetical protein
MRFQVFSQSFPKILDWILLALSSPDEDVADVFLGGGFVSGYQVVRQWIVTHWSQDLSAKTNKKKIQIIKLNSKFC